MLSGEEENASMVDSCGKKDKFGAQGSALKCYLERKKMQILADSCGKKDKFGAQSFALKCYLERKKMQIWLTVVERRISLVLKVLP